MADTGRPKLFGELGLGTSLLAKDVKEAEGLIKGLDKTVETFGQRMQQVNRETNLTNLKSEFDKMLKEVEKYADSLGENFKKGTDKAESEISRLENIVSTFHNVMLGQFKDGLINPDEMIRNVSVIKDFIEDVAYTAQEKIELIKEYGKSVNIFDEDDLTTVRTNLGRMERDVTTTFTNIENKHKAFQKDIDTRLKKQQKDIFRASMTQNNIALKEERVTYEQWLRERGKLIKQANANELLSKRELAALQREESNKNIQLQKKAESEAAAASREIWKEFAAAKNTTLRESTEAQINHLQNVLKNEQLIGNQRKQAEVELARLRDRSDKQREAALKRQRELLAGDPSSAKAKFGHISNYMFDAAIIYGSIRAAKEMTTAIKDIENASVELMRVMPDSTPLDLKGFREDAFEIAQLTSQNVSDVQDLQNMWARASDEIASSKEAMFELTRVTAMAMNVGGFESANEAVQKLNGTLNQMKLHWSDAEDVMSSWLKTAEVTTVESAKDLADVVMAVGSQAKQLGLNLHDLNALSGVLANNMSRSGAEIGTALKTIFSYIQRDETIKVLGNYGIEIKKSANEFHNFQYIMEQVNEAMAKFRAANNDRAIRDINEALGRVRRVDYVGVLTENWPEYQEILSTSMDAVGYAVEQNEKASSSLERQLGRLGAAFSQLAWEFGEAGFLDDLKAAVQAGTNVISWINSLDPAIKTGVLRVMEFSVAWTMLSKSVNLITGAGAKSLLLNTLAEWQLNMAKNATSTAEMRKHLTSLNKTWQQGAQLSKQATLAVKANTLAVSSNNKVRILARRENMAPRLETETLKLKAKTAGVQRNSAAIMQNIAARRALKAAEIEGTTTTSFLKSAASGLFTSINGWLMLVPAVLTGWSMVSAHLKNAKERTEALAKAQEELNAIIAKGYVEEHELPQLEERLGKLEDNHEFLQDSVDDYNRIKEAMESINQEFSNLGDGDISGEAEDKLARLQVQLSEAEKNIKKASEALKLAGVDGDGVAEVLANSADKIKELTGVAIESSDAQSRASRGLRQGIEDELASNRGIQALIDRFLELSASVETAADITDEYREIVMRLKAAGLSDLASWDDFLQTETLATKALKERKKEYGNLTAAQRANLVLTRQMTEETRAAALYDIDVLIKKQELLLRLTATTQYVHGTNNVEGYRQLNLLRQIAAEIKGLPTYKSVSGGGSGSGGGGSSSSSPPYKATVNRYQDIENAIESVNNQLRKMGVLLDLTEGPERLQYLNRQIELYREEQKLLVSLNKEREKERSEAVSKLKSMGFAFSGTTVTNYARRLAQLSGDTAKNAEELLSTYYRLTFNLIPEAQNKQLELNNTIAKIQDDIAKMNESIIKDAVDIVVEIEDKLYEIEKKRIEKLRDLELSKIKDTIKAEEERHKSRLDNLNAEYDRVADQINLQLKLLDKAEDERTFEKELAKLNSEKAELLAQYNELILDDSLEAQSKASDLAVELAEKEEEIDELKHERRVTLRRENLQDELEANNEARDSAIKTEDARFKAEKERLEKSLSEREAYYEKALQRDSLYQAVYKQMTEGNIDDLIDKVNEFENEFGKGLSIIGSKIKSELNDNLREAIRLMQTLYSGGVQSGGNFSDLVTDHYGQMNQVVGVRQYLQGKGYRVDWNAKTKETLVDGKRFDMSGFALQDNAYVGKISDIEERLKRMGFYASGGIITENQLAMLHGSKTHWEAVLNKPQLKELMNRVLTDFTIRLPKLNIAQPQPINFSFGNLLNVDGDITDERLKDASLIAKMVFDQLHSEMKKAGVM